MLRQRAAAAAVAAELQRPNRGQIVSALRANHAGSLHTGPGKVFSLLFMLSCRDMILPVLIVSWPYDFGKFRGESSPVQHSPDSRPGQLVSIREPVARNNTALLYCSLLGPALVSYSTRASRNKTKSNCRVTPCRTYGHESLWFFREQS